jgi:dTDP-4-amino-4,6-dideoxygalactose transaminase
MNDIIQSLPKQAVLNVFTDCIKMIVYAALLPPSRYWVVTRLPFLGLGLTPYTTDYPVHQYSHVMATIANILFDDLSAITQSRITNARTLHDIFCGLPGISTIVYSNQIDPVFLRFPLRVHSSDIRDKLTTELNKAGIGATQSYPSSIMDIGQLQYKLIDNAENTKGGRLVAQQVLTLPTHPYSRSFHIDKIKQTAQSIIK